MPMHRSIVQPNPGFGVICETCMYRHSSLDDSDFPCDFVTVTRFTHDHPPWPEFERVSIEGMDVSTHDRFGVQFNETCNEYKEGEPGWAAAKRKTLAGASEEVGIAVEQLGQALRQECGLISKVVSWLANPISRWRNS